MKKGSRIRIFAIWLGALGLATWVIVAFLPDSIPVDPDQGPKFVTFKQVRIIQYDSGGENAELMLDAEVLKRNEELREMELFDITGFMATEDGLPLNIVSDRALRDGFNGNIRFTGRVKLISPSNNMTFESNEAFFDHGRRIFHGEHAARMTEDSTVTTGEGFDLCLRTHNGELRRNVRMEIYEDPHLQGVDA